MLSLVLAFICLLLVGVIMYLLFIKKQGSDPTLVSWLQSSQQQMQSLQSTITEATGKSSREMSETMRQQTRDIYDRLTKATDVIGELKREAGAFSEVSRSMKELNEFLNSPKLRGGLGEQVLNDLIAQMFPKQHFFIQHRFKSGSIVDVALQTDAGILPIDSKFPMEHFEGIIHSELEEDRKAARKLFSKDVRKHIDDISKKYILPEEGTMDFAMMYIPSETVFYEIASDESLLLYARSKRVYPVSPTTLYAHLQTIMLSFEGKKIESKTREVFALLRGIEQSYAQVERGYETLGRHITNAHNAFTTTSNQLSSLGRTMKSARVLEQEVLESQKEELPLLANDPTLE